MVSESQLDLLLDSAENSTEEEDEEEEPEKEESKDEGDKEEEKPAEEGSSSKADGEAEGEEDKEDGNESIGSNEAGTSDNKDTNDKVEIDQEEIEDPSNLQLSWEMLELAKTLFQKHADSLPAEDQKRLDLESRLSETYQVLGEVSIENENYAQVS